MYEHRSKPPLSWAAFMGRMLRHALLAGGVLTVSLLMGMLGYLWFEPDQIRSWQDAFLDASMLLGGMGPVHPPRTDAGKIFAGMYALFSGIFFLVAAAIIVAPVVHRVLHLFHWEDSGMLEDSGNDSAI